jgi:hypothetical protein
MRRAAAGDSALTMTVSAAARTSCWPGSGASRSAACRARTSCVPETTARTVRVPTGLTARTLPGRGPLEGAVFMGESGAGWPDEAEGTPRLGFAIGS